MSRKPAADECAEGVQHALLGAAQCRGDRRLGGGAAGDGREHGEVEAPVLQATLLAEEPLVLTEQGGGGREDLVDDPGVEVVHRGGRAPHKLAVARGPAEDGVEAEGEVRVGDAPEVRGLEVVEGAHEEVGLDAASEGALEEFCHHRDRRAAQDEADRGPPALLGTVDSTLEERRQLGGLLEEVGELVDDRYGWADDGAAPTQRRGAQHGRAERPACPRREATETLDGLVPVGEGEATDAEVGAQALTELSECLGRLVLERLIVEAVGCSGEATQRVRLALPPPAVDDRDAQSRCRVGDEVGQLVPLPLPVKQVGWSR